MHEVTKISKRPGDSPRTAQEARPSITAAVLCVGLTRLEDVVSAPS